MRGGHAVVGDDRPAVCQHVVLARAKRDHGLYGDDHACLQLHAAAAPAVVGHVGVFVHVVADAVAHVLTHHAVAVGLCQRLHRMADVAQVVARNGLLYAGLKAVAGALAQALDLVGHLAHVEGPGVVPRPAGLVGARVNGEDVPILQDHVGERETVHDLLVHRRADAAWEAAVALEAGGAAVQANEALHHLVNLQRGNAGLDHLARAPKHGLGEGARRLAVLLHLLERLDADH